MAFTALGPLEHSYYTTIVGNEIIENHKLGLSSTCINIVNGKQDLLNKGSNITVNVGCGNVSLQNNTK